MNVEDRRSLTSLSIGLVISIAACFAAGAIGAIATTSAINGWYMEINKPTWNPPDWIFGPVWSTLYFMMGVSAWLVWKDPPFKITKLALVWFGFHLILNIGWSLIFFGLHQPGWALIEIIALWISIVVSIWLFYRHSKLAAFLLIPYLCWVTFAMYLNYAIWSLNHNV